MNIYIYTKWRIFANNHKRDLLKQTSHKRRERERDSTSLVSGRVSIRIDCWRKKNKNTGKIAEENKQQEYNKTAELRRLKMPLMNRWTRILCVFFFSLPLSDPLRMWSIKPTPPATLRATTPPYINTMRRSEREYPANWLQMRPTFACHAHNLKRSSGVDFFGFFCGKVQRIKSINQSFVEIEQGIETWIWSGDCHWGSFVDDRKSNRRTRGGHRRKKS